MDTALKNALTRLTELLGENRIYTAEGIGQDYCHDELAGGASYAPDAVVEANITEEIAAVLQCCSDAGVPVTVRGAGTGKAGGAVAVKGGVVLSLKGMNRILAFDEASGMLTVQPGVLLQDVKAEAGAHGLNYPPDPGEQTATIGGNAATNASGPAALKYGSTRDYIADATLVLANGSVVKLSDKPEYTAALGSEGTLAVIAELTLKLIPKPLMDVSLLLPFEEISAAIASVPEIKLANLEPQSIEFMERDIVDSSAEFTGSPIFPTRVNGKSVGAYILVTLVGGSEAELTAKMDRLAEVAAKAGAYDVLVVWTDGLKKEVWAARSAFLTAIEADSKFLDEMDVVVPVDRIADFLAFAREEAGRNGLGLRAFGHAGDGNLHIYCCSNELDEAEFKRRSAKAMDACYAKCGEIGGQVSGEHAIGHAKKRYLRESAGETAYGLMAAIKKVFDPNGILNPGKVCHDVMGGEENA